MKIKKIDFDKFIKAKDGHQLIITLNHSTPAEIWDSFDKFWRQISEEVIVHDSQSTNNAKIIDSGHGGWSAYMRDVRETSLSHDQLSAVKDLYNNLKIAFKEYGLRRYQDGLNDGRNCLFQLNNGTLSMDDFNNNLGGKNKHNI